MSYDGLFAGVTARQLDRLLTGAKIEKVYQPEQDEILLQVYGKGTRRKLLLSAQPSAAAVFLTERSFENPADAPAFCMLLRKHLQSARITAVRQLRTERIIEFHIETVNEMGYAVTKCLLAEIMGKHSNLILIDLETGKIVDSIKRISIDVNRYRQILPGLPYMPPPDQGKLDFWTASREELAHRLVENGAPGPKTVMDAIQGIGPTAAEEIWLSGPKEDLPDRLLKLRAALEQESGLLPAVYLNDAGIPQDVHILPLPHVFPAERTLLFDEPGQALDYYVQNRLQSNRVAQRSAGIHRHVQSLLDKLLLKKQRLMEEVRESNASDHLRLKAELLTAALHSVQAGDAWVTVDNYYDGSKLAIELDPRLSAAKNAQNYYKRYGKIKKPAKRSWSSWRKRTGRSNTSSRCFQPFLWPKIMRPWNRSARNCPTPDTCASEKQPNASLANQNPMSSAHCEAWRSSPGKAMWKTIGSPSLWPEREISGSTPRTSPDPTWSCCAGVRSRNGKTYWKRLPWLPFIQKPGARTMCRWITPRCGM